MRAEPLLTVLLLLGSGCDDGVRQIAPQACDPVLDVGCPANTHCRLVGAGEVTCLSRRARPLTDPCVPGSCEPGESCVELEGATACRPVCRMAEDDCPAPSQCAYQLDAESPYGLCSPACTLGQPCADGQTCTATARLDHLICGAVGPGGPGEPCDGGARCAADLACLVDVDGAARCRQLCAPAADACRQGACLGRIRQVAGVGFCTGG